MKPPALPNGWGRAAFDSTSSVSAVLDERGVIVAVNAAWRTFSADNGGHLARSGAGVNYLEVWRHAADCGELPGHPLQSLEDLLAGRIDHFEFEYPCSPPGSPGNDPPDDERWFLATVHALTGPGHLRAIVEHRDITALRADHQSMLLSQQRYQALFENALNPVLLADDHGHYVDANPAACQMLGMSREVLLQTGVSQVVRSAADVPELWGRFRQAGRETGRIRLQRADGQEVIAEYSAVADILPGLHLSVLQDVTDQHRVELALQEHIDRYDLVVDGVRDGIWDWDIVRGEVFYSRHWKALRGLPEDTPLSDPKVWEASVHPEDLIRVQDALRMHVKGQTAVFDAEYRVRAADGSWRWVHDRGVARRNAQGRAVRMAGAESDISERKLAEQALREREAELRETQRLGRIGHWVLSVADDRWTWSDQLYRLLGLDPAIAAQGPLTTPSLPPLDLLERYHTPASWAQLHAAMCTLRAEGTPYALELEIIRHDGRHLWVSATGEAVRDPAGEIVKLRGTVLDTTPQREAEAARRARDAAEQANRTKSEFLSRMSHELRTPLNAILGFADLLSMRLETTSVVEARRQLRHVQQAGRHLLNLIEDLLDISRIEVGALRLKIETVDLCTEVRAVVDEVSVLAAASRVTLRPALPSTPLPVRADRLRLRQVAYNLLSNAIKYNRPGGDVAVLCSTIHDASGPRIRLTVRDNGLGMTPAQVAGLFRPFDRLGRESSGIGGVGIGLSIVQQLVQGMGASLGVRSEPGLGSEFSVDWPIPDEAGDSPDALSPPATGA